MAAEGARTGLEPPLGGAWVVCRLGLFLIDKTAFPTSESVTAAARELAALAGPAASANVRKCGTRNGTPATAMRSGFHDADSDWEGASVRQ
jgi:hypothetical protein